MTDLRQASTGGGTAVSGVDAVLTSDGVRARPAVLRNPTGHHQYGAAYLEQAGAVIADPPVPGTASNVRLHVTDQATGLAQLLEAVR